MVWFCCTSASSSNFSNGYAKEVLTLCKNFKISGQGQRETPVADARGIVHIIMLPPCRAGAPVEAKICQRLCDLPQPMRGVKLSVGLTVFASAATCPNRCQA